MLRSCIRVQDGRPVRLFRDPAKISADIVVKASTRASLDADMLSASRCSFDVGSDEMVRFTLFELPDGGQVLLAAVHHLVFDALSGPQFVHDLAEAYRSFAATGECPAGEQVLAPAIGPGEPSPATVSYWRDRVTGLRPQAMLLAGTDYVPSSAGQASFTGGRFGRPLSAAGADAVRQLRRSARASDNIVLLAAYLALLLRHGAGPELVVGVPLSLRSGDLAHVIGPYFSTVPLVVRISNRDSFRELTQRALDAFLEALEHRDLSYEAMIRRFRRDDHDWQSPMFRHLFNFRPILAETPDDDGWAAQVRQIDTGYSRFDLEFVVSVSQGYDLQIVYRRDVHDAGFVRRLSDKYEALLLSAAAEPDREIGRLPMTTDHDKVIDLANRTAVRWRGPRTVAAMIDARINAGGQAHALISTAGAVTYQALGYLAGRIGARLAAGGVGPGDVVAVATGRHPVTAASILATWRLGAAYLPLDKSQPSERLRFQFTDAKARALVADDETVRRLGAEAELLIRAEDYSVNSQAGGWEGRRGEPAPDGAQAWQLDPDPGSAAYLIYTSGSTGKPKGVQITHGSLANVVLHFGKALGFGVGRRMLWLTTFSFDVSALELFVPLAAGGTVVIADEREQLRPQRLLQIISARDVDVIQATPTTWRMITALGDIDLRDRWLLTGGEPLTSALAARLIATGGRLVNVYGPTETTIWSTAELLAGNAMPGQPAIGRPISNTTVAVVDEFGADCPVDVVGEIVIAGAGVGTGYLRRADLTAEKFVRNQRLGRAYRTGDLGRWCADGRLALHGRLDRQVKIHGGRIELDEVESVLEEHRQVGKAAVVVRSAGQVDETLAAFVVASPQAGGQSSTEDIWAFAAQRLPGYAVPSTITLMPDLPASPSGKTDYGRLTALAVEKAPVTEETGAKPITTHDDITDWLVRLWQDALDEPGVGADCNLFLAGGQSLHAISIIDQMRDRYGVELPVLAIFMNPTPRRLAAELKAHLQAHEPMRETIEG